jgi:subtilisin family serine protease
MTFLPRVLLHPMATTLLIATLTACAVAPPSGATAQKQRIEKAADLPTFTYTVQGDLAELVRDDARFKPLSKLIARDYSGVLAKYDIAESASQRQYLGTLAQIALLDERFNETLRLTAQVKSLQDKPADKLLSGLVTRAIVAAAKKYDFIPDTAYQAEVARLIRAELDGMPFAVVQNNVMQMKASAEFLGEALVLGRVREVLQPVADKTGELSSDLAPSLVSSRFALTYVLPLKDTLVATYSAYLKANQAAKPDIWAARDVALPPNRSYKPVAMAVWDSGIDPALWPDQRVRDANLPASNAAAFIAFDLRSRPSNAQLLPITAEVQAKLPQMQSRSKGLSDAQSNIDSDEAAEVKRYLSSLKPADYKVALEALRMTGNYQHGTHVAGIAVAGNPYARLVNARIEFGHTLLPDPCPSQELALRGVENIKDYVAYLRKHGVRVANMSWGGDVSSAETELEQCNIGRDTAERKTMARGYFQMQWDALKNAMASAPEILFVAAAGNSGNDASFNEAYPASIVLPNLITVGAVDKAGDEAAFTSYGPTVVVHANGYQVESFVPGGERIAFSGTSMAAPQVANLAAKMLAVKPELSAPEAIAIIKNTAEKTADGRRTLIHPAKALAAVGFGG